MRAGVGQPAIDESRQPAPPFSEQNRALADGSRLRPCSRAIVRRSIRRIRAASAIGRNASA